jgi:REP element-mobilizing transposase RayT
MPQWFALIIVHLVFSTKDRTPILDTSIRAALHAYLATVARNAGCECFRVGGVADHVHLAISLSRTITAAKLVEELKASSSKWLKAQSPTFTGTGTGNFVTRIIQRSNAPKCSPCPPTRLPGI